MFLLMSAWSESASGDNLEVHQQLGKTFAHAGIGITITSLTDFLAFLVGSFSVFNSVRYFSLYAGECCKLNYLVFCFDPFTIQGGPQNLITLSVCLS